MRIKRKYVLSSNLALDVEGRVKSLEGHVIKFTEGYCCCIELAGLLVLTVTQLYFQFVAFADVTVLTVQSAVPAEFLGAVSVGCSLHGGVIESNLAKHWTGQTNGSRSVYLAHFDPEVFHPFSWSAGSVVNRIWLVLELR